MRQFFSPEIVSKTFSSPRRGRAWLRAAALALPLIFGVTDAHAQQSGSVDPAFQSNVFSGNGSVSVLVRQPDGKIIVSGAFVGIGGAARANIARLNADGSVDATFNPGTGVAGSNFGQPLIAAVAPQPDGKVVIAGGFTSVNNVFRNRIARLNADGSVDTTFDPGGGPTNDFSSTSISALAIQPDGKILIGGAFTQISGVFRNNIARLNSDGSLDADFNQDTGVSGLGQTPISALTIQPDGKILIGGSFFQAFGAPRNSLARLNPDGGLDASFAPSVSMISSPGAVLSLAVDQTGDIVVGGNFAQINGVARNGLARLNPDGSLDQAFAPVVSFSSFDRVFSIAVQSDNKVVIGGNFTQVGGLVRNGVARLNPDGAADDTFNQTGIFSPGFFSSSAAVSTVAVQPDGGVLVGGNFTGFGQSLRNGIVRLASDGSLEPTFDPNPAANNGRVLRLVAQPDGGMLVGGDFTQINGVRRSGFARLTPGGGVDATLNPTFATQSSFDALRISTFAVQPDGQILIAGNFFTVNGAQRGNLARLNPAGGLDATFTPNVNNFFFGAAPVSTIALQPDGAIVIAGSFSQVNGVTRNNVARLNPVGGLDTGFDVGTGANANFSSVSPISSLVVQADGRIIVGGNFSQFNGTPRTNIVRLMANGGVDPTFNAAVGVPSFSSSQFLPLATAVLQADGRILIGGSFTTVNGAARGGVARLNPDGTLDAGFNSNVNVGPTGAGSVLALAPQPDGKIIIGGAFDRINGAGRNSLARLNADGSLDLGFNPGTGVQGGTTDFSNSLNGVFALALQPNGQAVIGGSFTRVNNQPRFGLARVFGDPVRTNLNGLVALSATVGTFTNSPTPCAAPFADTLPLTVTLRNTSSGMTLSNLALSLVSLQERSPVFGVAPRLSSCDGFNCALASGPASGLGDQSPAARPLQNVPGTLAPGATTTASVTVAMAGAQRFSILFDVLGVASGGTSSAPVKLGQLAVTVNGADAQGRPLFATTFTPANGGRAPVQPLR
jgi:uncharacterized delta-60 repeat protein